VFFQTGENESSDSRYWKLFERSSGDVPVVPPRVGPLFGKLFAAWYRDANPGLGTNPPPKNEARNQQARESLGRRAFNRDHASDGMPVKTPEVRHQNPLISHQNAGANTDQRAHERNTHHAHPQSTISIPTKRTVAGKTDRGSPSTEKSLLPSNRHHGDTCRG